MTDLKQDPSFMEDEAQDQEQEQATDAGEVDDGVDYIEEIPDEQKDLLWALTKPIDEMTLEEQLEAIKKIRELRKVRVASTKRKSALDQILQQLTPDKASSLLKQLEQSLASTSVKEQSQKN